MRKISTALIFALQYLESRTHENDLDDDVATLEAIAAELQEATVEEQEQLRTVAADLGLSTLLGDLGI